MDYSRMFATNGEAVSGRLDRYYRWGAWAVIATFFACLYLLYCSYLTIVGRTTSPLESLSLQIILGTIGAIGALGGILLSNGMWAYWRQDPTSNASKRLWFCIMTFVPLFGCAAYYFSVYTS